MKITSVRNVDCKRISIALSVLPVAGSVQSGVVYVDLDPNREVSTPSDPTLQGSLDVPLSELFPSYSDLFGGAGFKLLEGSLPTDGSSTTVTASLGSIELFGFGYSQDSYAAAYPTSAVMGSETVTTKSFSVDSLEALNELPELSMRGFYFTDASSDIYYGWLSYGFRNAGVRNPEAPEGDQVYSVRPFISEVAFETTANTAITIGDKDGSAQNTVSEPMTLPLVAAGIAGIAAARRRRVGQG